MKRYGPRRRLEDQLLSSFAQVCQIYGIPPTLGRLYAVLYLSPDPMSLAELAEATGAAKSTTSVSLRRLERYRFVRRLPRGSDRKDYYVPVTDPLELLQDWVRLFVEPEMQVAGDMVRAVERDLTAAVTAGEYGEAEAEAMRERVGEMRRAMEVGQQLLSLFSDEDSPLQALFGANPETTT